MTAHAPSPFGALLKRYRLAAMLTQEQLASRAQLSADTIRALESGKRRLPRASSLTLILAALALTDDQRAALLATVTPQRDFPINDLTPTPGASTLPTPDALPPDAHMSAAVREPTLTAPHGRLRVAQPTPMLGRDAELAMIVRLLAGRDGVGVGADYDSAPAEQTRLLTLTGPAGVGKTRLALAAHTLLASYFRDGAALIDLAPIRDARLMGPTIAQALGVADSGGTPLDVRLREYLRGRSLLLTLDNMEQITPAASTLSDLLADCPGVALLVTSRVPLRLRWEAIWRVAPLRTPDLTVPLPPLDQLAQTPAIALFVVRARARRADFALTPTTAPLVARIVAALDGLPLAIELAAARLDALSLATIADRLGERLRLFRWPSPDLPERHQSLEAAIGWSYDLLTPPEQRMFRRLGVFFGQVALPAITAVLAAGGPNESVALPEAQDRVDEVSELETLASLAEKSLVTPISPDTAADDGGDPQPVFATLETAREYGREQLERLGELAATQRAHARYFLALAEQADPHLRSVAQSAWYDHLEHEQHNLRAALRWLLDHADDAERAAGLRLAAALGWFWWTRGYIVEGERWLDEALACTPRADAALRTRALLALGPLLAYQGAFERSQRTLTEALTLANQHGDSHASAQAYSYLGMCAVYAGDMVTGAPLLQEALQRGHALGDAHLLGMTLMYLGAGAVARGDDAQAVAFYNEALAQFEIAGDHLFEVNLQLNLGWYAWRQGNLRDAIMRVRAGAHMSMVSGNRRLLSFSAQLALLLDDASELDERADLARQARLLGVIDAMNQAAGMTLMQAVVKASLAGLRERLERHAEFAVAYQEGYTLTIAASATLVLAILDDRTQALNSSTVVATSAPICG